MKTLVILALLFVSVGAQGQKATPRKATLAEQKACSEQAAKVFHEHFPDSSDATYTSHYDPEANVCYAHIDQVKKRNGDTALQVIILDAFENFGYAVFYAPSSTKAPTTCTIVPLGKKEGVECTSKAEFDALVRQYYNLDN
jgi:hypothetical protein